MQLLELQEKCIIVLYKCRCSYAEYMYTTHPQSNSAMYGEFATFTWSGEAVPNYKWVWEVDGLRSYTSDALRRGITAYADYQSKIGYFNSTLTVHAIEINQNVSVQFVQLIYRPSFHEILSKVAYLTV